MAVIAPTTAGGLAGSLTVTAPRSMAQAACILYRGVNRGTSIRSLTAAWALIRRSLTN